MDTPPNPFRPWGSPGQVTEEEQQEMTRALDALSARPGVDPEEVERLARAIDSHVVIGCPSPVGCYFVGLAREILARQA